MSSAAASSPSERSPVDGLEPGQRDRYDSIHAELENRLDPDELLKFESLIEDLEGPSELVDVLELIEDLVEVFDRPRLEADGSELDEQGRRKRSMLPMGKPPGFGEPDDDCGRRLPETLFGCPCCGNTVNTPHNCYRYDCPEHGLHAVRRRAAGSSSMPGASARVAALRAMLDARPRDYVISHISINFPLNYFWRSDQPRERLFKLCREVLDLFDAQGWAVYHAWKSKEDGRGFWKNVLGKDLEWNDVRKKLIPLGHVHLVVAHPSGVAPGGAATLALEALTRRDDKPGVIIDRHTVGDSSISVYNDEAVARAITYSLSHAEVYTASDDSRRLAARFLGPDVNDVDVYPDRQKDHLREVNKASKKVLGISPPNMECNREVSRTRVSLPSSSDSSSSSSTTSAASRSTDLPNHSNVDATGEVIIGSSGMAEQGSGPASTPTTSTTTSTEPCGERLRHISTFDLEEIAELESELDIDTNNLLTAYTSYQRFMELGGRAPSQDGRPDIPEFEDRPPPD